MGIESMYDFIDNLNLNENDKEKENAPFDKEEYRQKKEEEKAELFSLLDQVTTEVSLSDGRFGEYLKLQGRLKYTPANTLLVLAQKPEATVLKDFDTWKAEKVNIKKHEKSIKILEPVQSMTRDGIAFTRFNVKKVLDISQTNAMISNKGKPQPPDKIILSAIISVSPGSIEIADELPGGMNASYSSKDNTVYIARGLDRLQLMQAAAYEIARANIIEGSPEVSGEVAIFQAKCAAYLIGREYGFEAIEPNILMPEELKTKEPKEIRRSLTKAFELLNEIKEVERQLSGDEKVQSKAARNIER